MQACCVLAPASLGEHRETRGGIEIALVDVDEQRAVIPAVGTDRKRVANDRGSQVVLLRGYFYSRVSGGLKACGQGRGVPQRYKEMKEAGILA